MSQALLPRLSKVSRSRWPLARRPASAATRRLANDMLREMAFVLDATRRVKEAMMGDRPLEAAPPMPARKGPPA